MGSEFMSVSINSEYDEKTFQPIWVCANKLLWRQLADKNAMIYVVSFKSHISINLLTSVFIMEIYESNIKLKINIVSHIQTYAFFLLSF